MTPLRASLVVRVVWYVIFWWKSCWMVYAGNTMAGVEDCLEEERKKRELGTHSRLGSTNVSARTPQDRKDNKTEE
jgi:hypothetical protein